jgi:hypothetical protein
MSTGDDPPLEIQESNPMGRHLSVLTLAVVLTAASLFVAPNPARRARSMWP